MTYNPETDHRRSIRLKDYDYSQAGLYFVTLCTWQRDCLFGEIIDDVMVLNVLGQIVEDEWKKTATMRPNVELDVFSVMPNHFHALFLMHNTVGAHCMHPESDTDQNRGQIKNRAHISAPLRRQSGSVGSIFAGFKSATTKQINQHRNNPGCPVWQRNYYERVIRNEEELTRARTYIVNNPIKWSLDKENPNNSGTP